MVEDKKNQSSVLSITLTRVIQNNIFRTAVTLTLLATQAAAAGEESRKACVGRVEVEGAICTNPARYASNPYPLGLCKRCQILCKEYKILCKVQEMR